MKPLDPKYMRLAKRVEIPLLLKPKTLLSILNTLPVNAKANREEISEQINIACSMYWHSKMTHTQKWKREIYRMYKSLEQALYDVETFCNAASSVECGFLYRAAYLLKNSPSDEPLARHDQFDSFKEQIDFYHEAASLAVSLIEGWDGQKKKRPVMEHMLVYDLAKIYKEATRKKFNRSTKRGGAVPFVSAAFWAVDPEVGSGTIDQAMRQVIAAGSYRT